MTRGSKSTCRRRTDTSPVWAAWMREWDISGERCNMVFFLRCVRVCVTRPETCLDNRTRDRCFQSENTPNTYYECYRCRLEWKSQRASSTCSRHAACRARDATTYHASVLYWSAWFGHLECVKFIVSKHPQLLRERDNLGATPFVIACG